MSAKYTPGPLFASREDSWPFAVVIKTAQGDTIFREPAYAYSSSAENLTQFARATGFPYAEREAVIAGNNRQMADAVLRAAAPQLLEALQGMVKEFGYAVTHPQGIVHGEHEAIRAAMDAIAKATGEA